MFDHERKYHDKIPKANKKLPMPMKKRNSETNLKLLRCSKIRYQAEYPWSITSSLPNI
jgi:hypothetical protein